MKVCKFGGTSMATAQSFSRVIDIIKGDKERRFVIVSAPGKINNEFKITDALIALAALKTDNEQKIKLDQIKQRFRAIVDGLKINYDLDAVFDEIYSKIKDGASYDYILSRGEYICAQILAVALGFGFVDAADIIKFKDDGIFDDEYTNTLCADYLSKNKNVVIPGFYGSAFNGQVKTFSRGGSDVSGAIIARAVNAAVYENWTDVDGFMICDPRLTGDSRIIKMLTYKELRELSYMGANVLHPESIFPVRKSDIPIHIKNTFNPSAQGTMIVPTKKYFKGEFKRDEFTITGIAGKKDFFAINIEKSMMNNEIGYARKILSIFENHGVSMEHMPSGIDTLTIIFEQISLKTLNEIIDDIKIQAAPDHIEVLNNLALIAIVGHGMDKNIGTSARIFNSIFKNDINVRMIDQGSSEMNIIIGVDNQDFEKSVKALYEEFK